MDHRDTHTHTHTAAHQPTHFTPYQSLGSKCPMKCNVVEQIQGLYLGWLTPGWDAKNTAFILGELIIITRQALAAPPPLRSFLSPLTQPCFYIPPSPPSAVDCVDPQCGGHGVCVRGECVCSAGWAGVSCDDPLPACQEQCSGHGTYLPESDTCTCQPNWTGPDCYTGKSWGLLFTHRKKENNQKKKKKTLKIESAHR